MWALFRVLIALIRIQLPANSLGKAAEANLDAWDPAHHVEDGDGIPDSWHQPGSYSFLQSEWVDRKSLSLPPLPLSTCVSLFICNSAF